MRLHITPFSESLAQSILSAHSGLSADCISYHTLDTFPEKSYGYITLGLMEAEKLKKRLNGSILKGKKLRIEHARPQKRGLEPELDNEDGGASSRRETRVAKRAKNSEPAVQGHELTSERKVKRGWTEPAKEKRPSSLKHTASAPVASKYTDKPECLFRAQLPPNKEDTGSGSTAQEQDRKSKKRKKGTIIHEFENSVMQPSFIRKETGVGDVGFATEYIDGRGWVDKNGNIIEQASKRQLRSRSRTGEPQKALTLPQSITSTAAQPSAINNLESRPEKYGKRNKPGTGPIEKSANEASIVKVHASKEVLPKHVPSPATSSSGPDSESEEESEQDLKPESRAFTNDNLDEPKETPEASLATNAAVHQLEALFKRPEQGVSHPNGRRPLEIKTTFNFFEPDAEQRIPQTPFTTQDLQLRGLRSAAPTPDTALPTRRFFAESTSPSSNADSEDGADVEKQSDGLPQSQGSQKEEQSEFAAWFWKNRGENNRAWKRRRREAMKEKRQSENRQRDRKTR